MQFREYNNKYITTSVRWGVVRNKNLSEQLDSATVILTNVDAMNIEPYDMVRIINENNNIEAWLIANVDKDYVTYTSPFKFDYTVDLMSLTKWLETISLPSMSITNIGQNRSIKSYIQRVVDRYVVPELSNYIDGATYTGLDSRFDVVCPEMKFEQTNAREFLDWMVGQFGCVISATFSSNKLNIGVLDLNQNVGSLPTEYIDDIKEMNSAQEYVTQFEHNMQDVIGQEPITEYVTLKGDGYVFNSDNAVAILSHKPYDILKVEVVNEYTLNIGLESPGGGIADSRTISISNVDITNNVVINEVYETLEIPSTLKNGRPVYSHTSSTTKNEVQPYPIGSTLKINSLSWSRGSKQIKYFNNVQEFKEYLWSNYTQSVIEAAIIENYLNEKWNSWGSIIHNYNTGTTLYYLSGYNWKNLLLKVTYIPYISPRLLVEQKDSFSHLVTMQDNSTNTQTELGKFLAYSLEKNSKLGNNSKIITGMSKVENSDYTPKLAIGQTWTDESNNKYVLSTLEYSIFKNSILYKGTLTKNYTNRNLNTIINREKRYYSLPNAGEAVERKEVTKEWYNIQLFSNYSGSAITISDLFEKPLFAYFTSHFKDNTTTNGTLFVESVYGGNLISHGIVFEDNISYATSVSDLTNDGYKMNVKKYVDEDGEFESIEFKFGKTSNETLNQNSLFRNLSKGELGEYSMWIPYEFIWGTYTLTLLKDSRERISWSLERIFYSNNSNIKLGNNFAELFKDKTKNVYLSFIYSSGGAIQESNMTITVNELLTSHLWSNILPAGTSGTLIVKENNDPNANVYLTINNFDAGDYFVFTTGSKRG